MPLIIPPGKGLCTWKWELNGDPERIVTTCGVDLIAIGGAFQDAAEALANAMLAAWPAAGMSNQWRFRQAHLAVGQDGTPPLIFEANRNVVGVGGANILPQNCAVLVRKVTASAGRRNRGRFYFPMLSVIETAVDQVGALDGPSQTDFQDRVNVLRTEMLAESVEPYILHSSGGVTPPGSPTAITSFVVEPIIATQRRRMRR